MILTDRDFNDIAGLFLPCDFDLYSMLVGYIPTSIDVVKRQYIGLESYKTLVSSTHSLMEAAKRVAVLHTIVHGFPRINIEITSSGLAVVSTQNLAPASRERTQKFLTSLEQRLITDRDSLFEQLLSSGNPSPWYSSTQCQLYCRHIVAFANDRRAAHIDAYSLHDIDMIYGQLAGAESQLRQAVGNDFVDDIIRKRLHSELSDKEAQAHLWCCAAVGASLRAPLMPDPQPLRHLTDFILENLSDFPIYANSAVYINTQAHQYENKKSSTGYFFS